MNLLELEVQPKNASVTTSEASWLDPGRLFGKAGWLMQSVSNTHE